MHSPEDIYVSPSTLKKLKEELEQLTGPGREEMSVRLLRARELGDLKENAEYHIAKDDQAHLETKIKRLTERLRAARVVEGTRDPDVVGFGSTVGVVDEASGRAVEFTLVGPTEADLKTGRLSSESPVARALVGARAGDTVSVETPGGERRYRVDSVS